MHFDAVSKTDRASELKSIECQRKCPELFKESQIKVYEYKENGRHF